MAKLLLQRIHWYECIKLALLARCTPDGTDIPINMMLVILLTHRPHTHYYYKWMHHNIVIKMNVYTTHTLTLLQYILPHNRQYSCQGTCKYHNYHNYGYNEEKWREWNLFLDNCCDVWLIPVRRLSQLSNKLPIPTKIIYTYYTNYTVHMHTHFTYHTLHTPHTHQIHTITYTHVTGTYYHTTHNAHT